ncbi:MAG: winged helix-turn-helix transcriptional regulator [Acidimicrobiia bacterium]|nr:winged helix-turn-helix transcriptional regulator [Acidimicrobiia bacterium]
MKQDRPRLGQMMLTQQQARLLAEPTRSEIIRLLAQRAATTSQLAEALGRPRGSIGHHLKALEAAGIVRVVRTRKVRALTEKYYGRVADTFIFPQLEGEESPALLAEAIADMQASLGGSHGFLTLRHARMAEDDAALFEMRLLELAEEFAGQEPSGDQVFGLVLGLYATSRPSLPAHDEEST